MPIRIATATLFLVATVLAALAQVPSELPALALGQPSVYRVEIMLALFYGGLLLFTPLLYGVLHGRLPVELSHHGAKWDSVPSELENTARQVKRLEAERRQLLQERRQFKASAEVGAGGGNDELE